MNRKKDGAKITLGVLKGKSITTSVPSIAIKFHANAEQVEELYGSDEESIDKSEKCSSVATISGSGEPESSPLKYFPKLIKRSTSIDVSSTPLDSSPPSDPWKFFSEIRGKITKSVEDKFTEIKHRNQEDNSPSKSKSIKDSKESSSLSDSEDLSESSISRTCGIVSTTEGVEMSSDDDTPSLDKDKSKCGKYTDDMKNPDTPNSDPSTSKQNNDKSILRHRFRLLKNRKVKDGSVTTSALSKLYNISTENVEQALPEDDDIESGVDALEENLLDESPVVDKLAKNYDNLSADVDSVLHIDHLTGKEVRSRICQQYDQPTTTFAPSGFVDLRHGVDEQPNYKRGAYIVGGLILYLLFFKISSFLAGLLTGFGLFGIYIFLNAKYVSSSSHSFSSNSTSNSQDSKILEIPAVDECKPLTRYEAWMNEYPEAYDATNYHISNTQSVFVRLQGSLLRISHTRSKIPKRAMWNEPKVHPHLTHHRVYNLLGAKICLLPEGLNKKRHWSKKYPICISLSSDQLNFNHELIDNGSEEDRNDKTPPEVPNKKSKEKIKKNIIISQQFSKLNEEDENYHNEPSTSRPNSPSITDASESHIRTSDENKDSEKETEAFEDDSLDEWSTFTPEETPLDTNIYLFGRTDREKEDWYRRLTAATHQGSEYFSTGGTDLRNEVSHTIIKTISVHAEFYKYMSLFNLVTGCKADIQNDGQLQESKNDTKQEEQNDNDITSVNSEMSRDLTKPVDVFWVNVMVGRILFDCMRDSSFTLRVKERLQRKLAAIKLPYFIEELTITELNLGNLPPRFLKIHRPVLDEKGIWVDMDISYEGLIVCTLQTKLNLMKLKQPQKNREKPKNEKLAMFNSDIDDSAESSSDEDENAFMPAPVLDSSGLPVTLGGSSNTSKKFIKMVDKIADSKFFQAATENRYIKRAMEGVSNTDLRLTVNLQSLNGTLVLNIPLPPSDRIWFSFRPVPTLNLSAKPIVGERNITFLRVTSWIEQQLVQEFQKILVIPNMEDLMIPVMCPDLPQ